MSDDDERYDSDVRSEDEISRPRKKQRRARIADPDEEDEDDMEPVQTEQQQQHHYGGEEEGDEEEEDEEDDEEDEDDEEEEDTRKRTRKHKKPANRFLDVEAVVDDDEEEEDEDDDYGDVREFIEEAADIGERDDTHHRNLTRQFRREEEPDVEQLVAGIKERHKRQVRYNAESDQVPQRLLMPGVDDPSLWQVRVKAGRERNITVSIFRKVFDAAKNGKEMEVSSVFYRDSLPGLVYVEARTSSAVHDVVNGLVGVYLSRGVQLVPIEEMAPLLRIKKKEINLTPGMWVRLKRGKYAGDLAQVVEVDQLTSGVVGVKFIPRIDLSPKEGRDRGANGKGLGGSFRPPQRLFNYDDVKRVYGRGNVRSGPGGMYFFDNDEFHDGFCLKDIKINFLTTEGVQPTLEEVSKFAGDDNDAGKLDLSTIADANRSVSAGMLSPGDQVEVHEGELTGMYGTVETIAGDTISIRAIGGAIHNQVVEVPAASVRKKFDVGEHVKIMSGKNADVAGMIVDVKGDVVTIMSDQGREEIKVFSKDVRKAADVSTAGSSQVSRFEVHDLVMLDSTTAAVVTKIDGKSLRIVDQNGLGRVVGANEVTLRRDNARFAVATDQAGNEVKVGDAMKEVDGENRRGEVINISRSLFVFLHNREYPENNGVFVARSTALLPVTPKSAAVDLTKMAPGLNAQLPGGGASLMPPPSMAMGNRKIINTPIVVTRGTYKGLLGTIKDVVGADKARVELATNNKTITVATTWLKRKDPKTGVTYPLDAGGMGGGSGAYGGGGGGGAGGYDVSPYGMNGGGRTPAAGRFGQTPNPYAMGGGAYGKTPNPYAGGKTPGYGAGAGGKTPAPGWGAGGGKTPGWAGGGGKTPGWAGAGAGAGGRTPAPGAYGAGAGGRTPAPGGYGDGGRTPGWAGAGAAGGGKTPNPYASAPTPGAYADPGTSKPMSAPTPWSGPSAYSAPTPGAALSAPTPAPAFSAPTPYSAPTPGAALSAPTPGYGLSAPTPGGMGGPTPFGAPTPYVGGGAAMVEAEQGKNWDWALDFRNVLVQVGPSRKPGTRNPRHFQRGAYDNTTLGIEDTVASEEIAKCYVVSGPEEGTQIDIPAEYLLPVRPDDSGQTVIAIAGDHRGTQRRTAYKDDNVWLMDIDQEEGDVVALLIKEEELARIWQE